jgi:hypothetical protein
MSRLLTSGWKVSWVAQGLLLLFWSGAALTCLAGRGATGSVVSGPMRAAQPSFTEEREAAALHFVRKQAADLLPLLEKLKVSDVKKYQQEIGEIFQLTELLSDLRDEDEKRYNLELEVWKTETQALILVAKLTQTGEAEQPKYKEELQGLTKKLVDLDSQVLKHHIEELERGLSQARGELARIEEKRETLGKERYEKLFDQAKRRGMMK